MTGKHAADLPVHVRRCQDNVPYLWYFDKATEIGFEWTGNPEDPIEVSQGGFGEPITNIITESTGGWSLAKCVEFNETRLNQPGLLYTFFWVSHSWLEHITADIRGREPQMVVGRG